MSSMYRLAVNHDESVMEKKLHVSGERHEEPGTNCSPMSA